jgi:hypothetical protein
MTTYKISKNDWATYLLFNTLEEAELWTLSNLGEGYLVEVSTDIQIQSPTKEEKLKSDIDFGNLLIEIFLLDNRLIEPEVTPYESLELLNKFDKIQKLASLGDIKSTKILLNNTSVDDRLFTQERKDKYLSLISNYKNN